MNWLRLLTANKSHAMVPLLLLTLMAMIILRCRLGCWM